MKKRILASLLSAAVVMFLGVLQRPVSGNDVGPDLKDLSARENQIVPIRISPSLQKILNEKTDGDPVKVGIWLYSRNKAVAAEVAGKYPNARLLGTRPSKDTPREAARQLRQDMNAAFRGEYQRAQAPIVRLVEGRGHKVLYASTAAPLVFAEIPKSLALQIGQLAEVDTVYPVLAYKPAMDGVVQALRVNPIWDLGYTGSGIRIGVIDAPDPASTNFSAIDFAHAEIKDGDLGITNYFDLTNTTPSDHATAMSGVIASQHAIYRGVAYGAKPLLSGNPVNDTDYELISASDWAIGQGPNRGGYPIQFIPAGEEAQVLYVGVQHFTGGAMETLDRYYDHVSYWHAVTVVTAAGNIYDPADLGYVASPGLSYNSITAGAYDYSRTAFWSDDFMMGNSRWKNPPDTDREKPEVAAVGGPRSATTGIVTPYPGDVFGWTGWTSAASAEVTGLVALLMEAAPSLQGWPETVKAIVMASAIHNIEGDGRLSDKDGAGGISVEEAVNVAKSSAPQQWEQVYLTPTDFANGNWYYTFDAVQGQRVRLAISWYSHPDGTYPYPYPPGTTGLESNLDLHISKTSGGAEFAHSTSSDNNYEIVDFEVPETTNYKARIQLQWLNPNTPEGDRYEYVGLAYSSTPIYQAEHSLGQELSSTATNAVVYVPIKLERFIKNSTNGVQTMPGISSYAVQVKLDTGKVTNNNPSIVLDVRNSTDFEITSSSNPGAIFTFAGAAKNPSSPPAAPTTVANLVVRLNGLARATDRLAVRFTSILNPNDVYQKPWFYRWYLRGDAEVNTGIVYDAADEVNSTDAYAIADYRVGNRPFESIDGVNAATPRQDGPGGDQVNMNDALFIQQYSTGLRDEWYIWIPKSGGSAAASSPGQATVSVGSAEAGKGTTVRVPVSVNVVNSSRGAGAYDFAISFDPRMLTVESVGAGDQPFGQPAAHRIDRAKGTVRLNGFLTTSRGLSGSSNVAYLTVKLVGGSGEKATLDVKSLALIDVLGNSIPVTERSGTLVIK